MLYIFGAVLTERTLPETWRGGTIAKAMFIVVRFLVEEPSPELMFLVVRFLVDLEVLLIVFWNSEQ